MTTGGQYNTPQTARVIRYAGLIMPLVLVAYGYLHEFGVIASHSYTNLDVLTGLSVTWLLVAIWQFLLSPRSKALAAARLTLYHILSAAFLLFVTGVATPFVACWIVLLIANYLYFERKGLFLSIGAFMIVIAIDILMWGSIDATVIPYDFGVLAAVLLSGLVVMSIHRVQSTDQTELRRSHEQEILQRDRLLTIVNNLTDAVMSTDNNNIIRMYNAACLDLFDTNDSLNGHHIDTALPLVNKDGEEVLVSEILKKASAVQVHENFWFPFEGGERVRLEMTVSPIRNAFRQTNTEARDGYILIMRDITKEKSLEEERDEFISVVSHELRTPITVVEGSLSNVEVMLGQKTVNKERLLETVRASHDQTLYLAKMINDLSALSRAERGMADECEEIDVKDLIGRLYDNYLSHAEEKQLALDIDVGAHLGSVEVSRLYLEELLQNLISNAIKYTKEGSVKIIARRKDDIVTFAVKDTGIGISKSDQSRIFDKFYRSEDYRTRETGGTGLGLYVVTKLARNLGTEVTLRSRLNYGSTFSFELPVVDKKK